MTRPTLQPTRPMLAPLRASSAALPGTNAAGATVVPRPTVLKATRVPQQLSFAFKRG